MRSPFCLLLLTLVALAACDSTTIEEPAPAPFTLAVESAADVVERVGVTPSAAFDSVPQVAVTVPPLLGEPADSALAERYRFLKILADGLSAVSPETFRVGYTLVRDLSPSGVAVAVGPSSCEEEEGCLPLVSGDVRVSGTNDQPGAVFFLVRDGEDSPPRVRLRPFALGGTGELVFEGDGQSQTVSVPLLGASPVLTTSASDASVLVTRDQSTSGVLIVTRRGTQTRSGLMDAERGALRVSVPDGDGLFQVYALAVEDDI